MPLDSIYNQRSTCIMCGWWGKVGEMEPDVDGDGSLGCPICGATMPVGLSDPRRQWLLRFRVWVMNMTGRGNH